MSVRRSHACKGYVRRAEIRSKAVSTDEKRIQKDQKERADIILAINLSEIYHEKLCSTSNYI